MDNTLTSLEERLNEPNWSGFQGGAPQLQWIPAPSQYGTSSINGGLIGGSSNNSSNNASHSNPPSRVVVINRDDRGFGFVVAGDNPVFVQTVREGGAAERAGIFKDDIIIKVNGSWVTQSNHAEVVDLIRAGGSSVALTVISPVYGSSNGSGVPTHYNSPYAMPSLHPSSSPSGSQAPPPPPPPPIMTTTPTSRGLHHQPSMRGGITSPQPVGHEQQRVVELERLNTFKLMLEKEAQFVETKRGDLARGYNPAVAIELASAEKRVRELQQKYNQMANRLGLPTSESQPLLLSSAQRSPSPAHRPQSAHYPGGVSVGRSGSSGSGSRISQRPPGAVEGGGWDNLGCDVPPPLPARNRSLVSHNSSPLILSPSPAPTPGETPSSPPPPLPPRNPSTASSSSCSSSSSSSSTAMPDLVPSVNGASNQDQHRILLRDSPTNQPPSSSAGRPSTSPLPSHHRTKSSPFPFPVQPVAASAPDTRRFSSSDSISELDLSTRRGGGVSGKDTDSPTHGTPPGTPPPPYRRPVSPLAEDGNGSETAATGSFPAAHQAASPSGVVYAGQETQLNILSMEEDEFSDHESVKGQIDDHGVFKTLAKLWQHNAHLAVFMNFVMSNCDPASLFFHLITDLYKEGTAKDMKKWAYEIHSTYLVPNAPLKLNNVDEHVLHEIDDALQVDIDKEEILRKVFLKARSKAKEELKRHLAEFLSKRTVGLATIFGPSDAVLDETIHDKAKEVKIVESLLLPRLELLAEDLENSNDRNQAIASSLATVLQKNFNVKGPQATSQIERCPTFVAKEKSIKPKFLSKNKKQLTAKGHHFVAHQYFSVTLCNHCGNVLWGTSPQGYQCTNCEMNIHKGCVKVIEESCIGALHRKDRGNDRISKIVDRFRPERELKRKLTTQGFGDKNLRRADDSLEASATGSLDSESSTASGFGMQSLRLKLRKRKYKLSLSRGVGGGGDREGPTAFKNAGSEWEFENFSPWIFTAKPCNTKEEDEEEDEDDDEEGGERVAHPQDDEDVKYWGPRPKVQGLVHPAVPNPLPPPPSHPPPPPPPPPAAAAAAASPATPSRYGILSYFPRRPSSWSPTSTVPPPIPPHAWQIRRRATARTARTETNGRTETTSPPPPLPPPKNRPISASHTDLKRSASCYQEPRDAAATRVSDSLSDVRSPTVQVANGSSSWGTRAANRLKRVQSELSSDSQQLLLRRPRTSAYTKLEPTYIAPYRCRSTNEVRQIRPLRKQSASLRHNGLMSTLASSESHLSGSYTLLSDDIDRPSLPAPPPPLPPLPPPSPPPPPSHRSSPPPPPVPPHAPGVLCTRITTPSAAPVYAVVLRNRPAGDKQSGLGSNGRSFNDGSRDGARDRRSGTGSGSDSFGEADRRAGYTPPYEEELDSSGASNFSKKKVSRSESLRERAQRKHREKRKHSDPNLPPSHSSDMDREDRSLSNNNSGSSSNSSLSTSLESPSPSDIRISGSALSDGSSGVSAALSVASCNAGGLLTPWDSDLEADPDPPDWTRNLDPDVVDKMTPKEKQRQEVVNELFHTERSHVRNLKVLDRVFYRPLLDNGFSDLVNLLFPNLPDMLEIHGRFNTLMKARKRDQPAVETVGDILVAMFDGPNGEAFQQAAATFCKYQSVALESLRDRRKKDSKLQAFLAEAEGNPVCRRLQLKDIIPTAMQRLTKYPLLLESLAKYTQPRSEEMTLVRRCLERSREILNKVNQAIKEAENYNRLVDIQRRLDKSAFEKSDHAIANELKNFELTKHRLIYEGALTWRTKGQKNVDLHVVLLEEYILLLQKQDDKYVLKFHSINYLNSKEESKCTHSPIIKIATVLVRPVATDKLALYLVNTSPTGAQIYDLVAVSIAERKAWFRHITDATEAYKAREGRNRRPDGSGSGSSPSMGSATPSLSSSSSSAQLLPPLPQAADSSEKTSEEPIEDNVSADSGVSLTPSTNETQPPPSEPASEQPPPPPPQQQQQSQPTNLEAAQAEASKKPGESGTTTPGSGSTAASPAPQRRLQRVEILKIAEGTPLIDPTEVVVSQGAVLIAEPVLTPLEKLRRKDQMIRAALADKQRLVADILHVPHSELDPASSELLSESEGEKEARLLVMTAIAQATQLSAVLNDSLHVTEEEAIAAVSADPTPVTSSPSSPRSARRINRMPGAATTKLLAITSALNKDLTQLLGIVTNRDEERDQLRRELQKTRDQLAEQLVLQVVSHPTSTSRPVSHVSLSDCEATIESEQSEGAPASPEVDIQVPSGCEGESNDGNESLVDKSIVPVEAETTSPVTSPFDEVDSAINSNQTLSEEVVERIDIGEKTEFEVSQSSEA